MDALRRLAAERAPVRLTDLDLVRRAEAAFDVPLGWRRRVELARTLRTADARSRRDLLERIARSDERVAALVEAGTSLDDGAFVRRLYAHVLRREADEGASTHIAALAAGERSREELARTIVGSLEAVTKEAPDLDALARLPNLRRLRPGSYRTAQRTGDGRPTPGFVAGSQADVDWLESMILDHGYYELPGVWSTGVDTDKRVMAQVLAAFAPNRALELGCSTGGVLAALAEHGVAADGVDLSEAAIAAAPADLPGTLHHGDPLDEALELRPGYDLVWGFDVFEHFNPGRLHRYLARVHELLRPGGFAVANIPAYGEDDVFGRAFNDEVEGWDRWAAGDGTYRLMPTDQSGFPIHGHLVFAEARWWVDRFAAAGLVRVPQVERAVHARYDGWLRSSAPARRSLFVFARDPDSSAIAAVTARVAEVPDLARVTSTHVEA